MNTPEYLYHYTSLDTLALILEHRTLCFNCLLQVDDIEEAEASDIKNFGKYVLVSCWTNEEKEMIPMWNLYTPNMRGVRIRLPVFPFEKYQYAAREYNFVNDCESYIDYKKIWDDNKGSITANLPVLEKVEYVNDKTKLIPCVRTNGTVDEVKRYLSGETGNSRITYSLKELGRYKREVWSFQKEWRYILWFSPIGMQEMSQLNPEMHREIIRRIEDENSLPPYQQFFLKLRQDAIDQMEIVFGPRMTEAEQILAKALLSAHGLDGHWKKSNLKIR